MELNDRDERESRLKEERSEEGEEEENLVVVGVDVAILVIEFIICELCGMLTL